MLAYEDLLRDDARQAHDHDTLVWAILAAGGRTKERRGPKPPPILRD
jgi:hypothetical protein